MRFQTRTAVEIAEWIRRRAVEIAVGEGDRIDPPQRGIQRVQESHGLGVHWVLGDYQNARGLGYIKVAAAEASALFDLPQAD